jgi:hypothetical protein
MRIFSCATATLALVASTLVPALAYGTVRVQQNDGTVRTYEGVLIKVVHKTLRITTHDGKGTLIISQAACAYSGELERCTPLKMSIEQGGSTKVLDFASGNIYVNPTGDMQQLSLSSTQLPPHGILLTIRTKIGTYVSLSGQIDELVR